MTTRDADDGERGSRREGGQSPLPRRISLGIALPPNEPFGPDGMRVAAVVDGSMAALLGLVAGDVVTAIDGLPIRGAADVREATRASAGKASVVVEVLRGGHKLTASTPVLTRPAEVIDGHEVVYGEVMDDSGARLRTLVTRPAGPGPHPAVLFLQGIGRQSLDFGATPSAPVARLIRGWAERGFVTMRAEKRGVGDSDGEEADFEGELAGARAALCALAADPAVDRGSLFLFGHSVGGMIAPLLAAEASASKEQDTGLYTTSAPRPRMPAVRGILVFGTSSSRWLDCLARSTARQMLLRGATPEECAREVARERAEGFGIRTPSYHAQLQARDIGAAWTSALCDVLVLIGELDWVVEYDEQLAIRERVEACRPGAVEVLQLDGTDHWMTWHDTLEESLQKAGRGTFDERLIDITAEWMWRRGQHPGRS